MLQQTTVPRRARKVTRPVSEDLVGRLSELVIGQPHALQAIAPCLQMFEAGLSAEGRPVGVFLLLGPTGTGKTRTAEALAQTLHGSPKHILRVDCGEFQMEHEVAKLIGAPPGYLGHRETQPALSQARLAAVTSEKSPISIVLFDEIEKAAPALTRLLLGVLDKAVLRLGDNNVVNFERSLILLTSNLGAKAMVEQLHSNYGLPMERKPAAARSLNKLQSIAMGAVRKQFSPEFLNRIDATITYQPLCESTLDLILEQQLAELQTHIERRLGCAASTSQFQRRRASSCFGKA